jgi:hypothetical protein
VVVEVVVVVVLVVVVVVLVVVVIVVVFLVVVVVDFIFLGQLNCPYEELLRRDKSLRTYLAISRRSNVSFDCKRIS